MSGQKIGGEYGQVRANIDAVKLNEYLAKHVRVIQTPVDVKQFKVRGVSSIHYSLDFGILLIESRSSDRYDRVV